MSDYIPTTDEVRETFMVSITQGIYFKSPADQLAGEDEANAEFDRWLAQHDSEITAKAEERIIKLLEQDMEHAFGNDGKCTYEKHYREVCNCDIIALIKGENR